ncbi:GntR family transcriptional regulator [Candidatus Spongiihabitans sp.]|uniref:GntR family transcriptional regulator n=1 Tax=Candidatus Spongiihabitans sp. TaxID=3101308 RepID=UPI003C704AE5
MEHSTKPFTSPNFRPLYLQVKDIILQRLAKNEFKPGDLLPSEPRQAEMLGVSQGTIKKALDELVGQNLLVRHQGKGTYVATHTVDRALFHFLRLTNDNGHRLLPDSRVVSLSKNRSTIQERDKLCLDKGGQVIRITRIRMLDSDPVIHECLSLPANRFSGLENHAPAELPNTLYRYYESLFHLAVINATEKLKAVVADENDAKHLGIECGRPLLEIDRVAIGYENIPLEWRVSRCNTAHYHYLTDLE